MCDRWPFPACQRWEGEKQREYLTHTRKHTSRASDAFPTALLSALWLWLADCWVMVECEQKENRQFTHTHTHTSMPNLRCTDKVIISTTQMQGRILFLCCGHRMQIFNMHRIYRWPQGWSLMSNMYTRSYIHRNTYTRIFMQHSLPVHVRIEKRERKRELEMRLWYWSSSYFYSFIFIMKCFDRFSPLKRIELLKCPNICDVKYALSVFFPLSHSDFLRKL